ncbi:S1/P1 nuclease [Fluviispira multicolorata]|uniref:S1/P1 Nuclease n=1 Tax=Fluviispira multicolorata TaxID=2654512 RepID=A0A833N541_9BACT|nr:S1/P1 nuclease [Fluviispira multicolorata]KAB8029807.1 hypothetical protein GCL57_09710 [Fluviispira multicolorata]
MKRHIKSFGILVTCFAMHTQVFAFWDQSHQLIGEIAEKKVNNDSLVKINNLLKVKISYPGSEVLSQNTSSLDTAASWADSIKAYFYQNVNKSLSQCHYVDIKLNKSDINKEKSEAELKGLLNDELSKEPYNSVSCLKSAIKTLNTSTESEVNKAIALRLVVHIIGDIGQPLHNVSLVNENFSDEGGNKIKFDEKVEIKNLDGSLNQVNNLHSMWDSSLSMYLQFPYSKEDSKIGLFSEDERNLNKSYANKILGDNELVLLAKKENNLLDPQSIESWVIDSHKIAIKYAYTDLKFDNGSKNVLKASFTNGWNLYKANRIKLMQLQILKSGMRLTEILDAIFSDKVINNAYNKIVEDIMNDDSIKTIDIK